MPRSALGAVTAAAATGQPLTENLNNSTSASPMAFSAGKPPNPRVEMAQGVVPYVAAGTGLVCVVSPTARRVVQSTVSGGAVIAWSFYSGACLLTCGCVLLGRTWDVLNGRDPGPIEFNQANTYMDSGGSFNP